MKIKQVLNLLFVTLSLTVIMSCDLGGQPDPGGTSTKDYAGDWFINIKDAAGTSIVDHALHATYNSSSNDNTLWIDDWITRLGPASSTNVPSGYNLRSKVTIDLNNGTFNCTKQPNLNETANPNSTVTITEGKIEKGAALSKGGHAVDKISFKAEFSYDPGVIIFFEGHKRTGFLEDEY
jgi:hypothetical protein